MESLAVLFPFAFFAAIFSLVIFLQKKAFQGLLKHFETSNHMPPNTVRPDEFRYKGIQVKNAMTIGEEGDFLFIKVLMVPPFKIPLSAFTGSIDQRNRVNIQFKDASIDPLSFDLDPEDLKKLPKLVSSLSPSTANPLPNLRPEIKALAKQISMPIDKTRISNGFRDILLLVLLGLAVYYYWTHYGF